MSIPERDYNSISPSAQALLLLKGLTSIPFAKEATALMLHAEKYEPDVSDKDPFFFARLLHFENRYWSIDQLLASLSSRNILEISSGFSFRGLQTTRENNIHYIDTDLPDLVEIKKKYIAALQKFPLAGKLETLPLNALDEKQFDEITNHFPQGEITLVNEGLLVYLSKEEKEKLCSNIHRVLKQRGGYWITADIYIKKDASEPEINMDEKARKFFEQHQIEEKKFDSFRDARIFFANAGFMIDKVASSDPSRLKLSSLKYLEQYGGPRYFSRMRKSARQRATWRLKAI